MTLTNISPKVNTVGTLLFVTMFVLSGVDKVRNTTKIAGGLQKRLLKIKELSNLTSNLKPEHYTYMIMAAAVIQLLGSYYLIKASVDCNNPDSRDHAKYAALALFIFTIAATYVYHWYPRDGVYYAFISNISTIGACLMLFYNYSR